MLVVTIPTHLPGLALVVEKCSALGRRRNKCAFKICETYHLQLHCPCNSPAVQLSLAAQNRQGYIIQYFGCRLFWNILYSLQKITENLRDEDS